MILSTDLKTGNFGAFTGKGYFWGFILTPAAADSTLTVYDNTTGSGKVLGKIKALANQPSTIVMLKKGVPFKIGCYFVLTGASAEFVGYYEDLPIAGSPN